jgi:hypothetical protein
MRRPPHHSDRGSSPPSPRLARRLRAEALEEQPSSSGTATMLPSACTALWAAIAGVYIGATFEPALGDGVPSQYFEQLLHDTAAASAAAAQLAMLAEAGEYKRIRVLAGEHAADLSRIASMQSQLVRKISLPTAQLAPELLAQDVWHDRGVRQLRRPGATDGRRRGALQLFEVHNNLSVLVAPGSEWLPRGGDGHPQPCDMGR